MQASYCRLRHIHCCGLSSIISWKMQQTNSPRRCSGPTEANNPAGFRETWTEPWPTAWSEKKYFRNCNWHKAYLSRLGPRALYKYWLALQYEKQRKKLQQELARKRRVYLAHGNLCLLDVQLGEAGTPHRNVPVCPANTEQCCSPRS